MAIQSCETGSNKNDCYIQNKRNKCFKYGSTICENKRSLFNYCMGRTLTDRTLTGGNNKKLQKKKSSKKRKLSKKKLSKKK